MCLHTSHILPQCRVHGRRACVALDVFGKGLVNDSCAEIGEIESPATRKILYIFQCTGLGAVPNLANVARISICSEENPKEDFSPFLV